MASAFMGVDNDVIFVDLFPGVHMKGFDLSISQYFEQNVKGGKVAAEVQTEYMRLLGDLLEFIGRHSEVFRIWGRPGEPGLSG